MSLLMNVARDLLALATPMTGDRSSGQVVVTNEGSTDVFLPRNSFLLPIMGGSLREDLVFRVAEGPDDSENGCKKGGWMVSPGGLLVDLVSNVGGTRHNVPDETVFRFDQGIDGLAATATAATAFTGGTQPTMFGGLKSVAFYDTIGPSPTVETFRAKLSGGFPAMVLVWEGSEPADGSNVDSLNRGRGRAGRTDAQYTERWSALFIASRVDGGNARRSEALEALVETSAWMFDRNAVDGSVFSAPGGVFIKERFRLDGNKALAQILDIKGVRFTTTNTYTKRDLREFSDWLRTRMQTHIRKGDHPMIKKTTDVTVVMPQDDEP
jgi:hypothetical protein